MEHKHTYKIIEEAINPYTLRVIQVCECGYSFTLVIDKYSWGNFKVIFNKDIVMI